MPPWLALLFPVLCSGGLSAESGGVLCEQEDASFLALLQHSSAKRPKAEGRSAAAASAEPGAAPAWTPARLRDASRPLRLLALRAERLRLRRRAAHGKREQRLPEGSVARPTPRGDVVTVREEDLAAVARDVVKPRSLLTEGLIAAAVSFLAIAIVVAGIALTAVLVLQRLLSSTLTEAIKDVLHWSTGLKVKLGRCHVSLFRGTVEFDGLVVQNPPGFQTDALISATRIYFNPQIWHFVTSRGETLVVNEVILLGVHAHVEHKGDYLNPLHSNVGEVFDRVQRRSGRLRKCCPKKPGWLPSCFRPCEAAEPEEPHDHHRPRRQSDVQVKRVTLQDITLGIAEESRGLRPEHTFAVGRLEYENFTKTGKLSVAEDVVCELMHSLLSHCVEHLKSTGWLDHVRLKHRDKLRGAK